MRRRIIIILTLGLISLTALCIASVIHLFKNSNITKTTGNPELLLDEIKTPVTRVQMSELTSPSVSNDSILRIPMADYDFKIEPVEKTPDLLQPIENSNKAVDYTPAPLPFDALKTIPVIARAEQKLPEKLVPLYENTREFVLDGDWSRLLAVGDIYKNGSYPDYLPDEDMALRIYHLCARCPDGDIAGLGQARYIETRIDPVPNEDRRGAPLPRDPGDMICEDAKDRISRTPFDSFQVPVSSRIRGLERNPYAEQRRRTAVEDKRNRHRNRNVREIMMITGDTGFVASPPLQALTNEMDRVTERIEQMIETNNGGYHISDAQNSHDHGVTAAFKKQISEMANETETIPESYNCDRHMEKIVDTVLNSDSSPDEKNDALQVIENLGSRTHSTYNFSERQIAAMIIDKIDKIADPVLKRNVKDTLVKQMASGVEYGKVVCSSGKIGRLMSTFDGTGMFENKVKPIWAVREEIGSIAHKIREEFEDDSDGARDAFEKRITEEYIDKLQMSKPIITKILEEFSEHL
ncbi:hypothetical protein TetV_081 [Tetraselmis virus 1]|uniref:Uncharacterized protein n=1 Tax=Tetraselmis virus 1 TaxID=2060617 RepID=A0A2P0VMR2_9VIRU|nr:hypothetical protein QJ968_gp081 [Tetraselmis virus 1]AUF82173.1 hypothetical protein TetV_081 [Tetraselmis virus 1]